MPGHGAVTPGHGTVTPWGCQHGAVTPGHGAVTPWGHQDGEPSTQGDSSGCQQLVPIPQAQNRKPQQLHFLPTGTQPGTFWITQAHKLFSAQGSAGLFGSWWSLQELGCRHQSSQFSSALTSWPQSFEHFFTWAPLELSSPSCRTALG